MPINQKGSVLPFVGVLILLLIVGGGAFYFGTKQNNQTQVLPQIPPPIVETSDTQTPNSEWVEYTSKKLQDNSFKAYTIKYPATWSKTLDRVDDILDVLTLSKNGHSIVIGQGGMGGGGCVFEGDLPEGPYEDLRNIPYTEIKSNVGILRRVSTKSNKAGTTAFRFCVNNGTEYFSTLTAVGNLSYDVPANPDPQTLTEMDNIVATLKESPLQ